MSSEPEFPLQHNSFTGATLRTPVASTRDSVQSANVNADRFWAWYDDYVKAVIGIAVLGGQITFTLIVTDIADPARLNPSSSDNAKPAVFQKETVRLLIALSWLFFTCTLGFAVITSLLFTGDRRGALARGRFGDFFYSIITPLLNFLPTGAFLLLSLAVAAYVPIVGWVGVVFISLFTLAVVWFWIFGW